MKSICLALFSAVAAVAHIWDSKIQGRMRSGEQPLPMENSINLKVPTSPMGFFQKVNRMPSGQDLRGKKASPFMTLNSSFRSFTTSVLDNNPLSVKECKKSGTVFEQRLVMLDELGQKRMEYQFSTSTGIQGGKVQSGQEVSRLE